MGCVFEDSTHPTPVARSLSLSLAITSMSRSSRSVIAIGYVLVLAVLIFDALLVFTSLRTIVHSNDQVEQSRMVIAGLEHALSLLKDADPGQPSYLLTGSE